MESVPGSRGGSRRRYRRRPVFPAPVCPLLSKRGRGTGLRILRCPAGWSRRVPRSALGRTLGQIRCSSRDLGVPVFLPRVAGRRSPGVFLWGRRGRAARYHLAAARLLCRGWPELLLLVLVCTCRSVGGLVRRLFRGSGIRGRGTVLSPALRS